MFVKNNVAVILAFLNSILINFIIRRLIVHTRAYEIISRIMLTLHTTTGIRCFFMDNLKYFISMRN